MTYIFKQITQEQAEHIAYHWHYDGEYAFYDMKSDEEDLAEFLDSEARGELVYVVLQADELVGFFSFSKTNEITVDIGLGMRPDLTGRGEGLDFVRAGMEFAESEFYPEKLTLAVAAFNKRGIKVYEKAGFQVVHSFLQATNGGTFEFVKMEYDC
ncbi:GNAT family N-acetyltransferase [Virgibacillus doumboii]|uniref:GNAT family N-acetyltransferase n=1 Tax=Virgibacillus doumboii TaxID=2697503 RepID=UPI0013DFA6E5|nr:GNAT family protein [Virgibacillus doumboii]